MGLNVEQIYTNNPSDTVNNDDLIYIGQSPFNEGDDSAIKFSDLKTTLASEIIPSEIITENFSVGQSGGLAQITNGDTPTSGDPLYQVDENGNHTFSAGGNFGGYFNVENPMAHVHFGMALGAYYNNDLSLSASQSATTVTGVDTSFNTAMVNGIIYWPSTSNRQLITAVSSATSLTVSGSKSQTSAPFIIFYGGFNYDGINQFTFSPLLTVLMNGIDSAPSYIRTLNIGAINAQLIQIGNSSGVVFGSEILCSGTSYNPTLALSASSSDITVTGSSTAFNTDMEGGRIYWPSTGNTASILSVQSTTELTIDQSISQVSAPFYIYYGGINIQPSNIAVSPLTPFLVNLLDTNSNSKVLNIGLTNADYVNLSCGLSLPVNSQITSPYTLVIKDINVAISFAAGGTVNLYPNPPVGMFCRVIDSGGTAGTFNITIEGNGNTINGQSTKVLNSNYATAAFLYNGVEWNIV